MAEQPTKFVPETSAPPVLAYDMRGKEAERIARSLSKLLERSVRSQRESSKAGA